MTNVKTMVKQISATELKRSCLKILDELGPNGIIITKRGQPVARLTPFPVVDNSKLIGSMKGKVLIKGNILSTGREWSRQLEPALRRAKGDLPGKSKLP
jgi:antitoxin (DNA-binding transcriptional repressor) of toxin-antitoxin stability system